MAYIFDPIRNTFIDDEDKSLGNKLALNDEEIDKVIKQIDDKFGPGTVVPASELPPKEDPYKDFMDRNPAADGGMMRQNFGLGSEPKVPKYPDLRMFPATPNEAQAKAKKKVIDSFKDKLKKYLLKQIKNFNKTSLPKEKFQVIENEIHRAMG